MRDDVADILADCRRRDAMLGVIRLLLFATAAGLAQRALHAAGHAIGIEDHPPVDVARRAADRLDQRRLRRSEEHTSELQSLMRISYAVFCLNKQKLHTTLRITHDDY